jgi:NAD(P)-dependent dehydrogenase (short-subunit alcohol dehydrogenase family)
VKTIYNKNILVFGAGDGLGKTLSLAFAREKANIIAVDKNKNELGNLEREIGNLRSNIKGYLCDLSSRKDVERTLKEVMRNHDTIDILVFAFCTERDHLFIKTSSEQIEKYVAEQIAVPCVIIRNLFEHLSSRKESVIISLPLMEKESVNDGIIEAISNAAVRSLISGTETFAKSFKSQIQFINVELTGKKTDLFFAANSIVDAVLKAKDKVSI